MNHEQLNEYIKHYLEEDKTKSAIMLTGPWGSGKSYYIQNELTSFLNKNCDNRCVIVSLYGLKTLSEVNKSLYFEMRLNGINQITKSETITTISTISKTVFKGITGFFNIDISMSEDELNKIYESVNYEGKLIIFEDLERTNIDIIEFMGYVNNLVEQDGIKVLLVANEEELLQYQTKAGKIVPKKDVEIDLFLEGLMDNDKNEKDKDDIELTDKSKRYIRIKEKSISDTITYRGDYEEAIRNIIFGFANARLTCYGDCQNILEIINILGELKQFNLRSFLFACQKTNDIYKKIIEDYDDDFLKTIFFGNIIFAMRLKSGIDLMWDNDGELSYSLGDSKYPLFKFCYQYFVNHTIDLETIKAAFSEFEEAKVYDMSKSINDTDLNIIFSFGEREEKEVRSAIMRIEKRLENPNDISFDRYGALANYLICITQYVNCDISKCLLYLVKNLKGRGQKIFQHHIFRFGKEIEDEEKKKEYLVQKEAMIKELNFGKDSLFNFDKISEDVIGFCTRVKTEEGRIIGEKAFMKKIDIEKFAELMYSCSSLEISCISSMLNSVYGSINIKEFLEQDRESIYKLLQILKAKKTPDNFDGIQVMQMKSLVNDLEAYLIKLS